MQRCKSTNNGLSLSYDATIYLELSFWPLNAKQQNKGIFKVYMYDDYVLRRLLELAILSLPWMIHALP